MLRRKQTQENFLVGQRKPSGPKPPECVWVRLNSKIRKWNQKTASPWNLCKHLVIKEAEHEVENRAFTGHFRLVVAKIVSRDSGIESKTLTCKRNTISEEYTTIMFTNGNSIGSRIDTTQEIARVLVMILDFHLKLTVFNKRPQWNKFIF